MVVSAPPPPKVVDMPEMTQENLQVSLAAMMNKKNDDLKLTKEEADRFTDAFAKPEFRALMAEYVDEISDPKNKAETDAYIRQLEEQVRRRCPFCCPFTTSYSCPLLDFFTP